MTTMQQLRMEQRRKQQRREERVVLTFMAVGVACSLALVAIVAYVVVHFIGKVW